MSAPPEIEDQQLKQLQRQAVSAAKWTAFIRSRKNHAYNAWQDATRMEAESIKRELEIANQLQAYENKLREEQEA